tara:strand:+ start:4076 stop:4474 length:399 start_codon:yes stop_codon:yes gene_type:complete
MAASRSNTELCASAGPLKTGTAHAKAARDAIPTVPNFINQSPLLVNTQTQYMRLTGFWLACLGFKVVFKVKGLLLYEYEFSTASNIDLINLAIMLDIYPVSAVQKIAARNRRHFANGTIPIFIRLWFHPLIF